MIKDALEVTRNLHRVIITASLATIVFSLSLRFPDQTRLHRETIAQFVRADFPQYDRFIGARASEAAKRLLKPVADEIRMSLEGANHLVFGLGDIANAFEKPILLGQFTVGETKLGTPSEFTVKQLETLGELYPLTENVRVVAAATTNLLSHLHESLATRGKIGMRVQRVNLETSDSYLATEAPQDGERIKLLLSFELMPSGGPPSQIIDSVFDATVHEIPDTSFQQWLVQRQEFSGIASVTTNGLKWLPGLNDLPRELMERRLGDVLGSLTDELKKGSPESKSVSLLGTEMPGILLVYATPLTLLALSYYFLFHLAHLCRFASQHRAELVRFAWLPLSLELGWTWESLFSLGVLPLLSLFVLSAQLWRFHFLEWEPGLFIIAAAGFIAWFCSMSIRQIGKLRGQIGKPAKVQWWQRGKG